jgi:hypothetical protein
MATPKEQLLSRSVFDTDGVSTVWDFAFSGGYLDKTHVKAYIETPTGGRTPVAFDPNTALIGEFQLELTPPLADGNELVIYRDTPKNLPLVDFTDESGFSEIALDTNAKQAVFIAAEAIDTVNALNVAAAVASAEAAAASAAIASAAVADISADVAAAEASRIAAEAAEVAAEAAAAGINPASFVQTTGDQTIGGTKTFSSPVTASITGQAGTVASLGLTADTTGRARMADRFVNFAKIVAINTARLLGRTTAGSGDVEEISIGAGLTLTGGVLAASASAPPAASETVAGVVELATNAETTTGTDTVRAVHPAGAKAAIDSRLSSTTPAAPGTAAVGTSTNFARADHVHAVPSSTQVGSANAGLAIGAIGSYLSDNTGATYTWSGAAAPGATATISGAAGTWRNMSRAVTNANPVDLALRVS